MRRPLIRILNPGKDDPGVAIVPFTCVNNSLMLFQNEQTVIAPYVEYECEIQKMQCKTAYIDIITRHFDM